MTLPLMDADTKVRTPCAAQPPLSADSTVQEAAGHLLATGDEAVVLWRRGLPVAVATRVAILQAMDADRGDDAAGAVADHVVVPVDRRADALATVHAFTRAAWAWLRYDRKA